jgi:hypothetical protein
MGSTKKLFQPKGFVDNLLLTVAFLLELVAFAALAGVGFLLPANQGLQIATACILFVAVIWFWGVYMAPKSKHKLKATRYYVAKAIIYALAAWSIFMLKGPLLGSAFALIALCDEALLHGKQNINV